MTKRKLKNWLHSYLEYTQWSESPERFHFWTGISTIAGALRRRVYIDMGYFTWHPNFYIFFVAPPGVVSKSTTANIGMDLLKKLEHIKFGPSSVTWQRLVSALAEAREDVNLTPGKDIATGAEFEPMCALTIVASELGTFFDPKNGDMTAVLCDLWDGKQGSWKKETQHSGNAHIQNPWINIIGCTTPSWIAENCDVAFTEGGFASRTIFVYGEEKRQLVAYPKRQINMKLFESLRRELVHDLELISTFQGEYQLTEEAFLWGEEWYEKHHKNPPQNLQGAKFAGYLARKQTLVHKTAMVLSASYRDTLVIDRSDLEFAEQAVSSIERDMGMVFASMYRDREANHTQMLLEFLQNSGDMPKATLFRQFMGRLSKQSFDAAMDALSQAGMISYEADNATTIVRFNHSEGQKFRLIR